MITEYQAAIHKEYSKEQVKELLERAGFITYDTPKKVYFKICDARDYSKVELIGVRKNPLGGNDTKSLDALELKAVDDNTAAAYVEVYCTNKLNSRSEIIGDWKTGLSLSEIQYLKQVYNLPVFENEGENETIWKITNSTSFDLSNYAEQAEFRVLCESPMAAASEDEMKSDREKKFCFYFIEDIAEEEKRKVKQHQKMLNAYWDFSRSADTHKKSILTELLLHENKNYRVENATVENNIEFFESLILPDNLKMLAKMVSFIQAAAESGNFTKAENKVYFYRLLSSGGIRYNPDNGNYDLVMTDKKTHSLGENLEASLEEWNKQITSGNFESFVKQAKKLIVETTSELEFKNNVGSKSNFAALRKEAKEKQEAESNVETIAVFNEETKEIEKTEIVALSEADLREMTNQELDTHANNNLTGEALNKYLTLRTLAQKKTFFLNLNK